MADDSSSLGGTGGPPSGIDTSGGSSGGAGTMGGPPTAPEGFVIPPKCPQYYPAYISLDRVAKADCGFDPDILIECIILVFMILLFVPPLILYLMNRQNALIKYRRPRDVFIGGIISGLNAILSPIIRMTGIKCIFNTWFVSSLIFSFMFLTFSRYVKTYYMQRLSIFKLKFSSRKAKKELYKKETSNKNNQGSDTVKSKESETLSTIKTSSIAIDSNNIPSTFSNEYSIDNSFDIQDPILYFKKLNNIINKKITIYFVIIPIIILTCYYAYITVISWNPDNGPGMLDPCPNEIKNLSYPKRIFNAIIMICSVYMLYQIYYVQKWDKELKIEYTSFIIVLFICMIIMECTTKGVFGPGLITYRVYIFQSFSIVIQVMCVIVPLIKIFLNRFKDQEGKLTEEEFLAKLAVPTFREQVREISTKTFCIENLLFFTAHWDLMNIVIQHYSKKGNGNSSDFPSFSSSDVLHRNTLNPILYKPFDPIFKPKYEQLYSFYIKEDGIAAVNINSSTIKIIEEQMENDNYSYLMFSQAAEEIGELLYSNIYPRMNL
ncbi:hypothetical protein H8356DRAFT_1751714 [Neocallimastix lanati (nom. inval.)]|nr:hypothetical protein H8356DRAFT_1751714 [Neocallimastix sp. JGI-2020a]